MASIEKIEQALGSVMAAYIRVRGENDAFPSSRSDPKRINIIISRQDQWIDSLITDPNEASLRKTIILLGEIIHEVGGMDQMEVVADRLSIRGGAEVCNSLWDGIGDWHS